MKGGGNSHEVTGQLAKRWGGKDGAGTLCEEFQHKFRLSLRCNDGVSRDEPVTNELCCFGVGVGWLQGKELNLRPLGYEAVEGNFLIP
jgi:hypothetical protein